MDELPPKGSSVMAEGETVQPGARVYSVPRHDFREILISAVLLIAGLALVGGSSIPLQRDMIALAGPMILLGLAVIMFSVTRSRSESGKMPWPWVKVLVGNDYIELRPGGAGSPNAPTPAEAIARVEREQIVGIRETRDGLVIATRDHPQALTIPIQLNKADFREIAEKLSTWCPIAPKPAADESKVSQIYRQLTDRIQLAKRKPLFYGRCEGGVMALSFVGWVATILLFILIIRGWDEAPQFSTNPVVVSALLLLFLIIMFGSPSVLYMAFSWLDYGLARIGLRNPTRSAMWLGIAAAAVISGSVASGGLNPVMSLILILVGTLFIAGVAWLVGLLSPAPVSYDATQQDLGLRPVSPGTESDRQILGAYRLTFEEFFLSFGCFTLVQPRSFGKKPRIISAFLPRSVSRRQAEKIFSSHPYQNRVMHIAIDPDAITWKVEDLLEHSMGWEQVKKVTRTPYGFLFHWAEQAYDWLPLHAFFTQGGPEAFVELARRRTVYSEMA